MFGIFKSIKKSSNLVKISNVFREDFSLDFQSMMSSSNKREKATEDLIDLAFEDKNNTPVIKKYKITRKNLKKKFQELMIAGAGQDAGGHFVAASSIVYAQTLIFLYDKKLTKGMGQESIAYALIEYFEQRKTGHVV
jgi:hypothetical protein